MKANPTETQRLEQVVSELCQIVQQTGWQRVHAIAETVARFAGESVEGQLSLRVLSAFPGCPLSKSQLRDALAARRVYLEFPLLQHSKHLTPSHAALLGSLERSVAEAFLESAERERWSVRQLLEEVRTLRRTKGERRGRPPTTCAEKAITRYDNAVLALEEAAMLLSSGPLSTEMRAELKEQIRRIEALHRRASQSFMTPTGTREAVPRPPRRAVA